MMVSKIRLVRSVLPCATVVALTIKELQEKAKITLVSSVSIVEGGAHDVLVKDTI
jgi:hypothetical protein